MAEAAQAYADWLGGTEERQDVLTAPAVRRMLALLDDVDTVLGDGDALPPLWHWMLFTPEAPQRQIDIDGHPKRGGFLPPVDLPRRMFAGASIRFLAPLPIGAAVRRHGRITAITEKSGKSGRLVFVTAVYDIFAGETHCTEETQNVVYREMGAPQSEPAADVALPAPPAGAWSQVVTPDPVQLFRYSALTNNGHRIHYDRPYTLQEEGYPGLVVHGPYIATWLAELVRRHAGRPVAGLSFQARAPIFDTAAFRVEGVAEGDSVDLKAVRCDGETAMVMQVQLG